MALPAATVIFAEAMWEDEEDFTATVAEVIRYTRFWIHYGALVFVFFVVSAAAALGVMER